MQSDRPERGDKSDATEGKPVQTADRITLSGEAKELRVSATVVEQTLNGAYDALVADGAMSPVDFEAAGRTDYLESIEGETDLSPEATAERILGGVTGYIFEAFKARNTEFSEEEFSRFHAAVTEGFERGLREAADMLRSMQVMTNEVSESISKTTELVRSGLADFYESVADTFNVSVSGGVAAGA